MGHDSIHFSPTGGTRRVADILVEGLQGEYQQIDLCHEIDNINMNEGDVCLISVPSYGGRVPAIAIDRLKKITGNGAKAVLWIFLPCFLYTVISIVYFVASCIDK